MRKLIGVLLLCLPVAAIPQTTFLTKPATVPWFATDISSMEVRIKGRLASDPATTHKIIHKILLDKTQWMSAITLRVTALVPAGTSWEIKSLSFYLVPVAATNVAAFELATRPLKVPHLAPAGQTLAIDYDAKTGAIMLGPVTAVPVPPPPAPTPTPVPSTITSSIANGATIKGTLVWTVTVPGAPSAVEFYVDGILKHTEGGSPYQFNGDPDGRLVTTTLTNGAHVLRVVARYPGGTSVELLLNVIVAN